MGLRKKHSAVESNINALDHHALDRCPDRGIESFKKYVSTITKVGGTILLLTGIAILTGQLQILGFFILEYFPSLGNIG